jgi:flagellar hook-associated protein 1 FlgK
MSMLNIGRTAIATSQSALSTTSHNIANVNTDGYNRQRIEQSTNMPISSRGQFIGSGVQVDSVQRIFDSFLLEQVRSFTSQEQQLDTFSKFAKQVDNLLGSPQLSLSEGFQGFFDAVQSLADDPTSTSARQVMLTEADILAKRFNTLDTQLDAYNKQVNLGIESSVDDINLLSKGIADLNKAIIATSGSNNASPNDLLDQRDQLINELSSMVSVSVTKEANGAHSVMIGNGQALVTGTSFASLDTVPNATDTTKLEITYGLGGINISSQITGGQLGGLLSVREDVIDPARTEIDALAAGMVTTINAQHAVGITLDGNAGGNFFEPTGALAPDAGNIRLAITDPRDIAVASAVTTTTSAANTGTAAITLNSVDGTAVGFDALTALNTALTFSYDAAAKTYTVNYAGDTATISYDPATDSGKSIDLSALGAPHIDFTGATKPPLTITLSGVPADTDSFTMTNSTSGGFSSVGDNRNALALAELQVTKVLNGGTQTYDDSYGKLVADVATRTHQADVGQQTQQGLLDQTNASYQSVSGVNLDEEAADLIKYQQAYQAASQIITVSNTIFNSLINAF